MLQAVSLLDYFSVRNFCAIHFAAWTHLHTAGGSRELGSNYAVGIFSFAELRSFLRFRYKTETGIFLVCVVNNAINERNGGLGPGLFCFGAFGPLSMVARD